MKKHKSLFFKSATKKRLLWVYLVTSIPLLVCILLGSEYGKRLLRQQSIQYNHNTLSLQLATVDTSLDHISNYLASFLLDENNYHGLQNGEDAPDEQRAILIIALVSFSFVTSMLIITWRQMVSPVLRIIKAMEAVEQGDFDSHLPIPDTHDEFAELTETFNYMIGQIHDLKLQIYEEKLNQAYAELQYLTLQIKPHFFLNCLNLIYSLGLSGRSELVVDFSATLMKYFRYLFKSSDSMVVLSEELKHVQNYLHIQQIRFQNDLDAAFNIDPQAEKMYIPVLTLHTFVENIFKHGCSDSAKMQIVISAAPLIKDGTTYLSLAIEDNGTGFSKEALETLSRPEVPSQKTGEKHIGIRNVRQRLSYIYGSNYVLRFENRSQGGAKINLLLPQNGKFHVGSA